MVEKPDIRRRVEAALAEYDRAGAALHLALAEIDTENYAAATGDLRQCRDHLDRAVAETREALELARRGMETGLIKTADEELGDGDAPAAAVGERLFEHLRRTGDLEGLFYEDGEAWDHLRTAALANDPLAGYTRFASLVTRVRNGVDGLLRDLEADEPAAYLQNAAWRTTTRYMRAKNFVQMLEFINRETRSL